MNLGDNIRIAREAADMTMEELGRRCGTTKQTIYKYETGVITNIPLDRLERIASALNLDPAVMLGWAISPGIEPLPRTKKLPLLGSIPCGTPALAVEDDELVDVPDGIKADFCLRARGDSMVNARIFDGDLVFIRQQDDVESGEIAAVMLNDEATLKRVVKQNGMVILMPENPAIAPVFVPAGQSVRILGKAVGFMSASVV